MEALLQVILSVVIVAIVMGVSLTVLGNFQNSLIAQNQTIAAENVGKVSDAISLIVNWMPTIIVIIVAALIISIVIGAFGMGRRR